MRRGLIFAGVLLLAWLASGFYIVAPDEQVAVQRFGAMLPRTSEPGAHIGLPWPLDRPHRFKPREIKRVTIGPVDVADKAVGSTQSQFLTGDRNLVQVRATVQYTVRDPRGYLFQTAQIDRLVSSAGTSAVATVLAAEPVDGVLTLGKQELATRVAEALEQAVDRYGLGIAVRSADISAVEPPAEVASAFDHVVSALRERERAVHQAESFANKTAAEAKGNAQRIVDSGRADHDRAIRRAEGEAARFDSLLAEYRRSPRLTASRLYLEALAQTLPKLRTKLIVDSTTDVDLGIMREDAQ